MDLTATPFSLYRPTMQRSDDRIVRDAAAWELALAAGGVAAARPAWRVPVLAVALVHAVLHVSNHLIDMGEEDPAWVGVLDVVAILALAAALAWLTVRAHRTTTKRSPA